MSMGMEIGIFLAYAAGMLAVYLAGRFLLLPLKYTARIIINSLAGGAVILLINCVESYTGIMIPLNALNALIAGVLGVPGIIVLGVLFN